MKQLILGIALIVLYQISSNAQSTQYEIGPRFSGLNEIGAIYKKKRSSGDYLRVSAALLSGSVSGNDSQAGVQLSAGIAIGLEKRTEINESLYFYRGFEPQLIFGFEFFEDPRLNIRLGLGYVLGLAYHINDKFDISIEAIPSILGNFNYIDSETFNYGISAGFNSSNVALSIIHRFEYSK